MTGVAMSNELREGVRDLSALGRELWSRHSGDATATTRVFADLGDWRIVAFDLIETLAPLGKLTPEETERVRHALDVGAFTKATPYFMELIAA